MQSVLCACNTVCENSWNCLTTRTSATQIWAVVSGLLSLGSCLVAAGWGSCLVTTERNG